MNKNVRFSDSLYIRDVANAPSTLNTKVVITARNCKSDGSVEQQVYENKTALPGRTSLLESAFPVTPNIRDQHIFINDNVLGETDSTGAPISTPQKISLPSGVNEGMLPRTNPVLFRRRRVAYWCAGDGAMNRTLISESYPAHITNTKLYHMIPFRVTGDGGDNVIDDTIYKGKVVYGAGHPLNGRTAAYFKKIEFDDVDSGIKMLVDGTPYNPSWRDTAPDLDAEDPQGYVNKFRGNATQSNYIDMTLSISAEEFKSWFNLTEATLSNATVSEIGLVIGYEGYLEGGSLKCLEDLSKDDPGYTNALKTAEVFDAEIFAHLTFDPYSVSRENASITIEYRVYS